MTETKKTILFVAVAAVLGILAWLAAPRRITPETFTDLGQLFFPTFTDPNSATGIEIISYNEQTSSSVPFKVQFRAGRWLIPSHNDYPADAKDRLAKTAAAFVELKKDDIRSDNVVDHAAFGVIDPADDPSAGPSGRGTRVTIAGQDQNVLVDLILGRTAETGGLRFVRVPGQKRVYAVKLSTEISNRFEDWIEKDLLKLTTNQIVKVVRKDYSVNERTRGVVNRDVIELVKRDNRWVYTKGEQPDSGKVKELLAAIDALEIIGVRKKPDGLVQLLTGNGSGKVTQQDLLSLQSKGFYVDQDGQLVSNEGELMISTQQGVRYTLRFGEVFQAGTDPQATGKEAADSRYLFVTTDFDAAAAPPMPSRPSDESFKGVADSLLTESQRANKQAFQTYERWQSEVDQGKKTISELNARYADWYYLITGPSYDKLHFSRADLKKL